MSTKKCKVCEIFKELTEFHKKAGCKDGRLPTCKICRNTKEAKEREKRKEQIQISQKQSSIKRYIKQGCSEADAENRYISCKTHRNKFKSMTPEEKIQYRKKYQQQWNTENKEAVKEKRKEYFKQYRKDNSEYYALACHRRRSRLKNMESFTVQQWKKLLDKVNYRCLKCNKHVDDSDFPLTSPGKKRLTKDHVIPFSKGGSNLITNIQPLCWSCHKEKRLSTTDYRSHSLIQFLHQLQNFDASALPSQ